MKISLRTFAVPGGPFGIIPVQDQGCYNIENSQALRLFVNNCENPQRVELRVVVHALDPTTRVLIGNSLSSRFVLSDQLLTNLPIVKLMRVELTTPISKQCFRVAADTPQERLPDIFSWNSLDGWGIASLAAKQISKIPINELPTRLLERRLD